MHKINNYMCNNSCYGIFFYLFFQTAGLMSPPIAFNSFFCAVFSGQSRTNACKSSHQHFLDLSANFFIYQVNKHSVCEFRTGIGICQSHNKPFQNVTLLFPEGLGKNISNPGIETKTCNHQRFLNSDTLPI